MSKKVLIVAGGTGGHIFPGLSVAKALKEQGCEILWVGTKDRMESKIVPEHGFSINFIEIQGIVNLGIKAKLFAPLRVAKGTWQSLQILKKFKPDVVVGMGGYVTGPICLAARVLGIPVVIHESNSVLGLTNKILSHLGCKLYTAFPLANCTQQKVIGQVLRQDFVQLSHERNLLRPLSKARAEYLLLLSYGVGNNLIKDPIELPEILTWESLQNSLQSSSSLLETVAELEQSLDTKLHFSEDNYQKFYNCLSAQNKALFIQEVFRILPPRIFSVGGSLGAKVLNLNVPKMVALLAQKGINLEILHQVGRNNLDSVLPQYKELELNPKLYKTQEFVDDMIEQYQQSDILICRSGSTTVFEIASNNRFAIFIPFPGHKDQQQLLNAQYLYKHQAATILEQKDVTPEALVKVLLSLSYFRIYQGAKAQTSLATPQATALLVQDIQEIFLNR